MMTIKKIAILSLVMFMLFGCATPPLKGPAFQSALLSTNDKGLVYIYWPGAIERLDFSIKAINESENEKLVFNMKHGGYYVFESSPGTLRLESSANFTYGQMALLDMAFTFNKHLDLDIKPGGEYYVRCEEIGIRGNYQLVMEKVDKGSGYYEIQSTKLLSSENEGSN